MLYLHQTAYLKNINYNILSYKGEATAAEK